MLLSLRLGGPLRPPRSAPGSGSGRCLAARLLICAPPSRTAPPRCSPRPVPRPRCRAPAFPRSPRCPPRRAGSRGRARARAARRFRCHRHRAAQRRSTEPSSSFVTHHQIKHSDGVAVDQCLQLGCHFAREVRLVGRESDDQVVDRPDLVNVDVRHVLLRSVAPSVRADRVPARRATRVVATSSPEFSGM